MTARYSAKYPPFQIKKLSNETIRPAFCFHRSMRIAGRHGLATVEQKESPAQGGAFTLAMIGGWAVASET